MPNPVAPGAPPVLPAPAMPIPPAAAAAPVQAAGSVFAGDRRDVPRTPLPLSAAVLTTPTDGADGGWRVRHSDPHR